MSECKWCGAAIKFGPGPALKPEWERWQCTDCCMFGYVNDPNDEELSEVYNKSWFDPQCKIRYGTGNTNQQVTLSLLKAVKFLPKSHKCLDFGGGKGNFARAIHELGCRDLTVYEPYGQNPGIESVNWINDTRNIPNEAFDYIFMVEVLEHLLYPIAELGKIFKYLAPGGTLVITTPNAKGWRARVGGFAWSEVNNPTHINLFTAQILKRVLTDAGFLHPKRILKPIAYRDKGFMALTLSLTQILGIDGGLRFTTTKGEVVPGNRTVG